MRMTWHVIMAYSVAFFVHRFTYVINSMNHHQLPPAGDQYLTLRTKLSSHNRGIVKSLEFFSFFHIGPQILVTITFT